MTNDWSYVWYASYGSNLSKQRFLCYIVGGKLIYGKKTHIGCTNKNLPIEDRSRKIPYKLYFALPEDKTETENWGQGGVAFIYPNKEMEESNWSWGRMWKITKEQYEEIKIQEGPWYNHEIMLGEEDDVLIYTITNKDPLINIIPPSDAYLKTMALGLKETYNLSNERIAESLMEKEGIKGNFTMDKLICIYGS